MKIEYVQCIATKMILNLKVKSYKEMSSHENN